MTLPDPLLFGACMIIYGFSFMAVMLLLLAFLLWIEGAIVNHLNR